MKKKCFKCNIEKSLDDFYIHKQMKDGHLNKCIQCAKKDVDEREKRLRSTDLNFIENEKIRAREKYHRLGYKDIHKQSFEDKKITMSKYKKLYPEKYRAKSLSGNIKIDIGLEKHHWSYMECDAKDIIPLSVSEHNKLHRHLFYDQNVFMYRRIDTMELLDTKEKHIKFYKSLSNKI